jgi:hypothetical protein
MDSMAGTKLMSRRATNRRGTGHTGHQIPATVGIAKACAVVDAGWQVQHV